MEMFVHRQTLANVMRFSTLELGELEARITTAADRALALELDIFAKLTERVLAEEGFPKLPRRLRLKIGLTVKGASVPESSRAVTVADLDGQPRIVNGRVDMVYNHYGNILVFLLGAERLTQLQEIGTW